MTSGQQTTRMEGNPATRFIYSSEADGTKPPVLVDTEMWRKKPYAITGLPRVEKKYEQHVDLI